MVRFERAITMGWSPGARLESERRSLVGSRQLLIELKGVWKVYLLDEMKVEALRGVSLGIDHGEYVALMGPSGSGKSTLMNTLGCLDRPTDGSYLLDGIEVATMSPMPGPPCATASSDSSSRTSTCSPAPAPWRTSSCRSSTPRQMSTRQRRQRARDVLELVGLADRMGHHPGQLSGGQQQRVAIARAIVNEPAILMADEPTGNLDSRTSKEVMELFRDLNEKAGLTIILVTHDPGVARRARRLLVLRDGEIVQDTPDMSQAIQALHFTNGDASG